jgi:hypothetical protein
MEGNKQVLGVLDNKHLLDTRSIGEALSKKKTI